MKKGFAKIDLKSLKECGNFLDLLLACTGNKPNYGSPSFLTSKIGDLNKSSLRRTHRGLKTLLAKGLIILTENGTYHAFASEAETNFVQIPNDYCTLSSNELKVLACLIYAKTLGKKTSAYKIKKLTGMRADLAPILAKIEASVLIEDRKDLLARLDKTSPVPQKTHKKAISPSTPKSNHITQSLPQSFLQQPAPSRPVLSDEEFAKHFPEIVRDRTESAPKDNFNPNSYIRHVKPNFTEGVVDPFQNRPLYERRSAKAVNEDYETMMAKFNAEHPEALAAYEANKARQKEEARVAEERFQIAMASFGR